MQIAACSAAPRFVESWILLASQLGHACVMVGWTHQNQVQAHRGCAQIFRSRPWAGA